MGVTIGRIARSENDNNSTADGTVRGTVIVIFGSCDPSDGYSPYSPFTYCTVRAVDLTYNTWMNVT